MTQGAAVVALFGIYLMLGVFYVRLDGLNGRVRSLVRCIRSRRLRTAMIFTHRYYDIGGAFVQISLVTLLLGLLWDDWRRGLVLPAALFGQTFIVHMTKTMSGRARPPHETAHVLMRSGSYPSGHTAASTTIALLVPTLLSPYLPAAAIAAIAAYLWFMALATAFGRLYLDMHWMSDLLGGWILSMVIFLLAVLWLSGAFQGDLSPAAAVLPAPSLP